MTLHEQIDFIKKLDKLAALAAKHDICLGNGGDVSSNLGAMSSDLYYIFNIEGQIKANLEKIAKSGAK